MNSHDEPKYPKSQANLKSINKYTHTTQTVSNPIMSKSALLTITKPSIHKERHSHSHTLDVDSSVCYLRII